GSGSSPISQDQRNTLRSRVRFQAHPRLWFAFASSYNSGLPFEIEGSQSPSFIAQQYGSRILQRVNEDRGRVLPSATLDVSAGVDLLRSDQIKLHIKMDVLNLTTRLTLIIFGGVFSGTAVAAPRSYAARLRREF